MSKLKMNSLREPQLNLAQPQPLRPRPRRIRERSCLMGSVEGILPPSPPATAWPCACYFSGICRSRPLIVPVDNYKRIEDPGSNLEYPPRPV